MDADIAAEAALLPANRRPLTASVGESHDLWAAALFLTNLLVVAYIAMVVDPCSSDYNRKIALLLSIYVRFSIGILVVGLLALTCMLRYPSLTIKFMLYSIWIYYALFAVLILNSGSTRDIINACIFGAFCIEFTQIAWSQIARSSTPFPTAALSIARKALGAHKLSLGIFFCLVSGLTLIWMALCFTTTLKLVGGLYPDHSHLIGVTLFFCILSLYWGCQVANTVVAATVSGTVADWWYEPTTRLPVLASLWRSVSKSFGSLCLGGLTVSVVGVFCSIMTAVKRGYGRRNDREPGGFRQSEERVGNLNYFNKYAYCYIATYGYDFKKSGQCEMRLLGATGWMDIIEKEHGSQLVVVPYLCMTALMPLVYELLSDPSFPSYDKEVFVVLPFVGGAAASAVGFVLSTIIDSGVSMVYVCYAEGEDTLMVTLRTLFFINH